MSQSKSEILAALVEIARANIAAYRAGDLEEMSAGFDDLFERFGEAPPELFRGDPDLKLLHDYIDVFADSGAHNFPDMGRISVEKGCDLLESAINDLEQKGSQALDRLKGATS